MSLLSRGCKLGARIAAVAGGSREAMRCMWAASPDLARGLPCSIGMLHPDDRVILGKSGENYACLELERRGYAILERRYRTRLGEIDVIAWDGDTLVFVEVKARRSGRFGPPAAAVTALKQQRLVRMASFYVLHRNLGNARCRFDVVSVTFGAGDRRPQIDVFKGAFEAR